MRAVVCLAVLVVMALVLFDAVLTLEESQRADDVLDSGRLVELLLQSAKDLDAAAIRTLLLVPSVNPNVHRGKGSALFLIVNRDEESSEMLAAIEELLKHPAINPNGAETHWPVLKVAILKGHDRVVERLLKHPKTKRVVHPSGLSCQVVGRIPELVSIAEDKDAPDCVKQHPRYNIHQGDRAKTTTSARQQDVIDWSNPFQPAAHNGQRPPHHLYVMNPEAFDNILDAARYYVFGRPWSGGELAILVGVTAMQGAMACFVLRRA